MTRPIITKPKQAGSPRSLDRWELSLNAIERELRGGHVADALLLLAALRKSLRRAERR